MRASAFDPPAIPPGFWERADVCRALRKRDMGTLFRLVQDSTPGSARPASAPRSASSRAASARSSTAPAASPPRPRLRAHRRRPRHARPRPDLLGLSPRQSPPSPHSARTAPARPGQDSDLLRQITAARSIDSTVVRVLQAETDNIRLLDRRLGAPAVAGKLEAHISHVETGLRYSLRPGNRQQLAAVLADASALAGWQAIDMGRLPRAWAHFERATAAAREAGDPCLLAFAAGEQAYVLLDLHRPADALAMVRAAYDETRTAIPHQLRGWLRAAEAEMAAAAGQESTCRASPRLRRPGSRPRPGRRATSLTSPSTRPTWPAGAATAWSCSATPRQPTTSTPRSPPWTTASPAPKQACAATWPPPCTSAASKTKHGSHLKRARELAQVTGSARQRRRIRDLTRRIGKAA